MNANKSLTAPGPASPSKGHWRRQGNRVIWINWMIVGDPDLGFIDKHYRL